MSGTLRGGALKVADRLRGGQIARELADIASAMKPSGPVGADRTPGLERLLDHATRNVPFYGSFRSKRLSEFPVMNKALIRDLGDEALARGHSEQRTYPATTSGSTGTPFRILRDHRKQLRIQVEAIYWGRVAGYELGQTLFYMKVWSGRNRLGRVAELSRNIVPVDIAQMQPEDYVRLYDDMARRRLPLSVLSYSSALDSFLRAIEAHYGPEQLRRTPRVAAIIAQSEALSPEVRLALAGRFARMPYARYGLEELGIVGQQVPGSGDRYLVNSASHFVEVLDHDRDEPAQPGAEGRIVVTDLINVAQPMIRYDTGDVGSFAVGPEGAVDATWLQTVSGRRQYRIYDVHDRPLSPMLMYKIWWRFPEIKQHQLVQRGRGDYLIRLNVDADFGRETEFVNAFIDLVGSGARCEPGAHERAARPGLRKTQERGQPAHAGGHAQRGSTSAGGGGMTARIRRGPDDQGIRHERSTRPDGGGGP